MFSLCAGFQCNPIFLNFLGVVEELYSMETGYSAQLIHAHQWTPFCINPIIQHLAHSHLCLYYRSVQSGHLLNAVNL